MQTQACLWSSMGRNIRAARFSTKQRSPHHPLGSRVISGAISSGASAQLKRTWRCNGNLSSMREWAFPAEVLQHLQPPEFRQPQQQPNQPTIRPIGADASQQSGIRRRQWRLQPPLPKSVAPAPSSSPLSSNSRQETGGPLVPFHSHCGLITSIPAVLSPRKMYWYQDFFSFFPFSMFLI
jgi:hypothetical protein